MEEKNVEELTQKIKDLETQINNLKNIIIDNTINKEENKSKLLDEVE